jgi:hypothetical protein
MASWTTPAELAQPLPRRTRMTRGFILSLSYFPAVFAVFGLMFLVQVYPSLHKRETLRTHGSAAEATITNVRTMHGKRMYYAVDYRFSALTPAGVREFRGTDNIGRDSDQTLSAGREIPIVFDPSNPNSSILNLSVHPKDEPIATPFVIISCAIVFCIGWLLLSLLLNYRKQRGLVRWGRVTQATVTDKREVPTKQGKITRLTYRFVDSSGRTVEGHWRGYSVRRLGEHALESPLVLFDADNSSRNTLYPVALVDCIAPAHP